LVTQFGDALTQLLHERGLTQSELGRRLGVTGSAVNLWANGRANPSRENIERIEDELAVEPRGAVGLFGA
jgi:transcriptional regulator with XRE-family HTH domain